MGVRVMRWDNFTVVYGACTEYFSMGTCGFYKALGPAALRLHIEATSAHRNVLPYTTVILSHRITLTPI